MQSEGLNILPKREKQRMIGASRESCKKESTPLPTPSLSKKLGLLGDVSTPSCRRMRRCTSVQHTSSRP
nr:MAG TPA: hypothetical protein [Caudoviricetes sp.]